MYEVIDARKHGHGDIERPVLIVERWGDTLRRVMAFRACDEQYAAEVCSRMNDCVHLYPGVVSPS